MNRTTVLVLAALLSTTPRLVAQEQARDSIPLVHAPPIVVTPHRATTPAVRVASSVTVVTRDEIERRQHRTVLDVLRDVPGVTVVRNGGTGGVTSVFLRGAGSDHALILVDGVEINDPSSPANTYDLAHLLTADVDRIEILRGPQSTLYGSSAMGGVIHVFTRRGEEGAHASLLAEGGSHGTAHLAASVSGGRGRLRYAISGVERRSDGISAAPAALGNRERDPHRVREASGRLAWIASGIELGGSVRVLDAENDFDLGVPTGDDPNLRAETTELSGRVWGGFAAAAGRWRQTVSLGFARHDRATRDEPDPAHPADRLTSEFDGGRWKLEWIHEAQLAGRLIAGVDTERETASGSTLSESAFGPFASELPEESARTSGVFAHHELEFGPFAAALGARVDDHDRFGAAATFRVAPVLRWGGTRFKGTYGTGFKAPTLFQLFDPQFGDPDLDPETSRGWDAGLERDLADGRLRLGVTAFAARYEDLIAFESDGFRNVRAATSRGLEASASVIPAATVRLRTHYTYTGAEDASGGPEDGEPLIRRPRHQASVLFELALPRQGDLALEVRYVGEREDLDFSSFPARRVTLDDYALVRVAGSVAWGAGVDLFARVENLLDAQYEEVFGFGTPGRAVYGGVEATF
jgi:vitamin B12 transporter